MAKWFTNLLILSSVYEPYFEKNERVMDRVNFLKLTQIYSNFPYLNLIWTHVELTFMSHYKIFGNKKENDFKQHTYSFLFDFESLVWLYTLAFQPSHRSVEVFSWWHILCFRKLVSKSQFPTFRIRTNSLETQSTMCLSRLKIFAKVSEENIL